MAAAEDADMQTRLADDIEDADMQTVAAADDIEDADMQTGAAADVIEDADMQTGAAEIQSGKPEDDVEDAEILELVPTILDPTAYSYKQVLSQYKLGTSYATRHSTKISSCCLSSLLYVIFCFVWKHCKPITYVKPSKGNGGGMVEIYSAECIKKISKRIFTNKDFISDKPIYRMMFLYQKLIPGFYIKIARSVPFQEMIEKYGFGMFGLVREDEQIAHYFIIIRKPEGSYAIISAHGCSYLRISQYETALDIDELYAYVSALENPAKPKNKTVISEFMKKYFFDYSYAISGLKKKENKTDTEPTGVKFNEPGDDDKVIKSLMIAGNNPIKDVVYLDITERIKNLLEGRPLTKGGRKHTKSKTRHKRSRRKLTRHKLTRHKRSR